MTLLLRNLIQLIVRVVVICIPFLVLPEISVGQTVYVDTFRIGHEKGPQHPEYSDILRDLLRKNGVKVIAPVRSSTREESSPDNLPHEVQFVEKLILKNTTLSNPANLCGPEAADSISGMLTVGAYIRNPGGQNIELEDRTTEVTIFRRDVSCGRLTDITPAGAKRIFGEALTPIAQQIVNMIRR